MRAYGRFLQRRFGVPRSKAIGMTQAHKIWHQDGSRPDYLFERQCMARDIEARSENGVVVLVSSGMDCDGVRYSGQRTTVPAILVAVERAIADIYNSADGPVSTRIASRGEVVEYTSRDLGMEAFENGHPHVIRGY